jgi:hypothetical protein
VSLDCSGEADSRLAKENGMSYPMTLTNPELWRKIEVFEIDEGKPNLTFAARLARENGWTVGFARKVVEEYKRFVYLAMVAGHRVTPSEHVDQAWHLHMVYTGSYWDRLCGEVLPRPLKHTPTEGGTAEDTKFDDWYAKTKESYQREFGAEPPREIWPEGDDRFGHDLQWRRVNTSDNWVVPKKPAIGFAVLGAAGLGMAACGVAVPTSVLGTSGTTSGNAAPFIVVGVLVLVFVVAMGIAAVSGGRYGRRNRNAASGGCGGFWYFGGGCGSSNHDSCGDGSSGDCGGGDGGGGGGCGGGGCGGGD